MTNLEQNQNVQEQSTSIDQLPNQKTSFTPKKSIQILLLGILFLSLVFGFFKVISAYISAPEKETSFQLNTTETTSYQPESPPNSPSKLSELLEISLQSDDSATSFSSLEPTPSPYIQITPVVIPGTPIPAATPILTPKPSVSPTPAPVSVPITPAPPVYDLVFLEYGIGNASSAINPPHDMHIVSQSKDAYVFEESAFVGQPYHPLQTVFSTKDNSDKKISQGKVKLTLIVNGAITNSFELDLNEYSKYDGSFFLPDTVGTYAVTIRVASTLGIVEKDYLNNEANFTYQIIPDKTPPVFDISVADLDYRGTCATTVNISDNSTQNDHLTIVQKVDNESWTTPEIPSASHCFVGTTGDTHTFTVKMTDERGNTTEKTKGIVVF